MILSQQYIFFVILTESLEPNIWSICWHMSFHPAWKRVISTSTKQVISITWKYIWLDKLALSRNIARRHNIRSIWYKACLFHPIWIKVNFLLHKQVISHFSITAYLKVEWMIMNLTRKNDQPILGHTQMRHGKIQHKMTKSAKYVTKTSIPLQYSD